MGKCKICGTEIADTEEMCEDCKALDDVDLIKSDDELEELLNSVMHSHTSYPNDDDNYTTSDEMTIDPIKEIDDEMDSDDISIELDNITNDLLKQYSMEDEDSTNAVEVPKEEEAFSIDSLMSEEEEPFSLDSLTSEEEEPFSLDSLVSEEEEPFSLDSLVSEEEEPFSLDSLVSEEEEPFSLDSLASEEEEPFSLDSLASEEEEPFSLDSLSNEEEESFSIESLSMEETSGASEDIDLPISELHSEEVPQIDNDLYASIPGFEGIFDGIDDDNKDVSDVGNIFADVLGTVSNYGADEDENYLNDLVKSEDKSEKNTGKKSKKKEKKSLFKDLFANIENEDTKKEFLKEKELEEANAVKKAAKKEQQAAKAAAKKEKKAEQKKARLAAKAALKAAKEQKLAEVEEDHSKINKKGATVVFMAFAALAAIIILGTNSFSYNVSISQAKDYFSRGKYTKAYNEISGVQIKEDDQELANKIKTVMYVNKEYDSYNNYYAIQYYAEALNSLLNGLTKYDLYLEQATELGVKSDLQFVKSQILTELEEKYNIDEESAKKITSIEDQEKYSDKVFAIAEKLVADNKK